MDIPLTDAPTPSSRSWCRLWTQSGYRFGTLLKHTLMLYNVFIILLYVRRQSIRQCSLGLSIGRKRVECLDSLCISNGDSISTLYQMY